METILITGGAGFIGTSFVHLLHQSKENKKFVILDALTYAGNFNNIKNIIKNIFKVTLKIINFLKILYPPRSPRVFAAFCIIYTSKQILIYTYVHPFYFNLF